MPDTHPDTLRDAVDGARLMAHLERLARWVKLSGTGDELASLRETQAVLDGFGYRTTMLMHDAYISLPGPARVTADGTTLAAITHSFSRPSPPGGITWRLVDVGEGTESDFAGRDLRGAIVLATGIASPAVARRASDAGAVAQLHASPHEHLHEMCISPVWGSPSAETLHDLPRTVAATISAADGASLRARLASGAAPEVVIEAAVDTGWRQTPILVADHDGPRADADAPFVLFSGHHDTWYFGVMDNGAANATMLEAARILAGSRASWRRGLRLCFWSGHSHGRYSGSTWYADAHWDELDRRCVAHVNVDSTGGVGASVLRNAASSAELAALAEAAIGTETNGDYAGRRMSRSSDQSFNGIGLPAMLGALSEQPPEATRGMRNALGWWWHTPHDLIDKIDTANLVRDTRVFVSVLARLLCEPVLPIDHAAQMRPLLAELGRLRDDLGDRFDLAPLVREAEAVREAAIGLRASAGDPDRINLALMRASRALVPVDAATGDRFGHDAALPLASWPALQPLRDLAAAEAGSDAARFLAVSAVRARNRLGFALRQAAQGLAAQGLAAQGLATLGLAALGLAAL